MTARDTDRTEVGELDAGDAISETSMHQRFPPFIWVSAIAMNVHEREAVVHGAVVFNLHRDWVRGGDVMSMRC